MSDMQTTGPSIGQVVDLLTSQYGGGRSTTFVGAAQISDPFNEVSKADPPQSAWYVLATVKMPGEDAPEPMSFQIGEKSGVLKIYHIFEESGGEA